jgi:uncharacterized protein
MKVSYYTLFTNYENKYFAWNLLSNFIVNLTKDEYLQLKNNKIEDMKMERNNYLFAKNIITENNNETQSLFNWFDYYINQTDEIYLYLIITDECNCECSYCFEKNDIYSRLVNATTIMQSDLQVIASKLLSLANKENVKKIHISITGGEPLIFVENIYFFCEEIKKIFLRKKVMISYDLSTNGILLNKTIAKKLKDYGFEFIQIPIDGTAENHNNCRPIKCKLLRNYNYNIVMNSIKEVDSIIDIVIMVIIRRKDINQCDKILNNLFAIKDYIVSLYFGTLVNVNNCILIDELDDLIDDYEFATIKSLLINKSVQKGLPIDASSTRNVGGLCYSIQNLSFVINTKLSVYRCPYAVGDIRSYICHVSELQNVKKLSLNLGWNWKKSELKFCKDCKILPLCFGGCRWSYINFGQHRCIGKVTESEMPKYLNSYVKTYKNVIKLEINSDHREKELGGPYGFNAR